MYSVYAKDGTGVMGNTATNKRAKRRKAQREEFKKVMADRNYWMEFANTFGWRLYGFTYSHEASFLTTPHGNRLLEITGDERDTIMRKVRGA